MTDLEQSKQEINPPSALKDMADLERPKQEINPPSRWTNDMSGFYFVDVELPGFKITNMRVKPSERRLIVTGRRKIEDDKHEHFQKTFNLPEDGDYKNVTGKFFEGVLRILIPKLVVEEIKPSSRWTNDFPGYHCILITLIPEGFTGDDIKVNVDESRIITVTGRRMVDDKNMQYFKTTFNFLEDGNVKNIQKLFDKGTLIILIPKPVEEEINISSEWTNDISGSHCLRVDIPGFKKDDIKVNVGKHGTIVVSGRRKVGYRKREQFEKIFNVPEDGDINNIHLIFNEDTLRVGIPKMIVEEISPPCWTREYPGFHCLLVYLPGFTADDVKLNVDEFAGIIVARGRRRVDNEKQEHFVKKFDVPKDGNTKIVEKIFNRDTLRIFIPQVVDEEIIPSSGWTDEFPGSHCLFLKLPGFKEDDIKLSVDKHEAIVLSGTRRVGDDKREFFENKFDVPIDGDVERVQMIFKEDTLKVRMPKLAIEEINPSSQWTDDIHGYHCIVITLPGFTDDDIKLNVDKFGSIVVSGRRKVDDSKQEHFEKKFNMPEDGSVKNIQKKFNGNTLTVFIPKPVDDVIIPSSGWTNDTVGSHCLLVNLPVFKREEIKTDVDESGVIVVSGMRHVDNRKQEHFIKAFYVPEDRDMKSVIKTFEGDTLRVCIPKKATTEYSKPSIAAGGSLTTTTTNNDDDDKPNNISSTVPNEIHASKSDKIEEIEEASSSSNIIEKDKEASDIGALDPIEEYEPRESRCPKLSNRAYRGLKALLQALPYTKDNKEK